MRGLQMHLSPWTASSYAMLVLASLFSGASGYFVSPVPPAAARFTRTACAVPRACAAPGTPSTTDAAEPTSAPSREDEDEDEDVDDAEEMLELRTLDLKSSREYKDLLLKDEAELGDLMSDFGYGAVRPAMLPQRGVFCTRALDMREIDAIGYDMDYTLIDYKMVLLEERVYHYSKEHLRSKGFPVSGMQFDHELVVRGLILDKELGHVLKADRFGYVRRAMHGTRVLSEAEITATYGALPPIDLREDRWVFLNTLFSVSEGCLYAQLVDRLDSGQLFTDCKEPFDASRCSTYEQLYRAVAKALFTAHVQSTMKEEIMQSPLKFVTVDPTFTQTLLDQRAAGKKLALITNSDWVYTNTMMAAAYGPFLPDGMTWKDLFEVVVVSACKPDFFSSSRRPVYEIATDDGMLREAPSFERGRAYAGGNAKLVERCLGASGSKVLYVGDHLFTDVNVAKRGLSWRTCLILQELEGEMEGLSEGRAAAQYLTRLLRKKDLQAAYVNHLRTLLLHHDTLPEALSSGSASTQDAVSELYHDSAVAGERSRLLSALEALEGKLEQSEREIREKLATEGNHVNYFWGYMSRGGFADKSHLMRQIEKYADIYTSRVSNLARYTPFKHFLSQRQSLAHSMSGYSGRPLMEHWRIDDHRAVQEGSE